MGTVPFFLVILTWKKGTVPFSESAYFCHGLLAAHGAVRFRTRRSCGGRYSFFLPHERRLSSMSYDDVSLQ